MHFTIPAAKPSQMRGPHQGRDDVHVDANRQTQHAKNPKSFKTIKTRTALYLQKHAAGLAIKLRMYAFSEELMQ